MPSHVSAPGIELGTSEVTAEGANHSATADPYKVVSLLSGSTLFKQKLWSKLLPVVKQNSFLVVYIM